MLSGAAPLSGFFPREYPSLTKFGAIAFRVSRRGHVFGKIYHRAVPRRIARATVGPDQSDDSRASRAPIPHIPSRRERVCEPRYINSRSNFIALKTISFPRSWLTLTSADKFNHVQRKLNFNAILATDRYPANCARHTISLRSWPRATYR